MCGHVIIGEQKDIKMYSRSGQDITSSKAIRKREGNPGSLMPVVTDAMPDKVQQFRWGILTQEDNQVHDKYKHARVENLTSVPIWRNLLGAKHCVTRIQAFFEYSKTHQERFRVMRADGQPFYIAGLWDIWFDVDTHILIPTFAMITTRPNEGMAKIHDRMPVILERADIKTWLDPNLSGEQRIALLKPTPSDKLIIISEKEYQEQQQKQQDKKLPPPDPELFDSEG